MKFYLTIALMFISAIFFGQSYTSIITEAEVFYNNKEYEKSIEKYKEAFKINQQNANDLYNASCSSALNNNIDLAFDWLNLAVKNGWLNLNHLKSDTDLTSLHNTKEWDNVVNTIQLEIDKIEANYDKELQSSLLTIFNDDQVIRHQYIAAQKEFGNDSKQVDSLIKIMIYNDSVNLIKVTEILDKYGWVGADKVGGQASHALFLVIQHSDLETQQKYLPIMRKAVENKKISANSLALLEDRVAIGEGKRQIYGSQIGYDEITKKYYVLPLYDPDNIDTRRQSVGLGSFTEYLKKWDIIWNVEEYKKDLQKIEEN